MGRRAIPNAELKIYREVVSLSKSHAIRKIATVDIAYRMRVSETVIFKRFATKEDLLNKTFIYCFEQFGDFSFNTIIDRKKTDELRLDEFSMATDTMSLHLAETNYVLMYVLSEYFEIGQLENIPNFNLISIRNDYPSISSVEFEQFIKQSLIMLLTHSISKTKDGVSDAFGMSLLPEIHL